MARGCNDWHATRRAFLGRTRDVVPIPADAFDGLERFARDGGLTRRNLLARGVGLWVGASALAGLSARGLLEAAAAQAADAPDAPILVSLYLDGGNDGLNTLVPLRDSRYRELRRRLAIPAGDTLPLPDTDQFGWHPSLEGVKRLYDEGKVAVLPAVDYAKPDLSHFNSVGFWRTGIAHPSRETTGWLGRTVDAIGTADNPLQAISASWDLDPVLSSRRAPTATVFDPNEFTFWIESAWDDERMMSAYRDAVGVPDSSPALAAARAGDQNAFRIQDRLKPLRVGDEDELPPTPVEYPDGDLGSGLRNLARMLGAGFGTRVAAINAGDGYDTHDNQPDDHANLLRELGDSLWAFQADLAARGLSNRVLTLVWSELGRRPEDNDSNDTDHGAGGLVLLVGDRANGGIRSEFPGLAQLDREDNLRVTTEFRTVYATLLEGWLGVEAGRVLPGIDNGRLPLVA